MAKKIRILCRSAHVYGNHKNMIGFDLHNTRKEKVTPEDQNYNSKLSAENVFFSKGKIVKHGDLQQLISEISDYQEKSISGLKGGMSKGHVAELNVVKSKTKAKIFKWAESASNPAEKVFFQALHEKIGVEEISFDSEIEALKSTGKVGRLNDKVKAIKQLENCNPLLKIKYNKSLSLKIISSEKIFKIPDKHNVTVSPEHWNAIIDKFHNKYYSNFEAFYTAIHLDEKAKNPHAHHRMSGLNKKNGMFDLPDHELNLIRSLYKKPDLFGGKPWSKLNGHEVKEFGEKYQKFMFQFVNLELKALHYDVVAVKRTEQEKKADKHVYSSKRIRGRVFNGVNQLIEQKNEAKKDLELTQKTIEKAINKVIALEFNSNNLSKKIEQQQNTFQKLKGDVEGWLKNSFKTWFEGVLKFKISNSTNDLESPLKHHLKLEEINKGASIVLNNQLSNSLNDNQNEIYRESLKSKRIQSLKFK